MQQLNESNFSELANRWYQTAENHEASTSFKTELFDYTEVAASTLEHLVQEGSTEQAQVLANIILQPIDSHRIDNSEGLINWIGANTLKWGDDVKGAYNPFHHLLKALQAVDGANASRLSSRDYNRSFLALDYIDSEAMNLLKKNDASIHGHKHKDQIISDDILNLFVQNSVRKKPVNDSIALQAVSKKNASASHQCLSGGLESP